MNKDELKIRLAFSGGGFRATFYSLGAFRRLVELGLWEKVCRIDSVSGGSITAAVIMTALTDGKFRDVADFDKRVTEPLKKLGQFRLREKIVWPVFIFLSFIFLLYLKLISYFNLPLVIDLILFLVILYCWIQPTKLFSFNFKLLLDIAFFKRKFMKSLVSQPEWRAQATCLNTGKRFRFGQKSFTGGIKIGLTEDNEDVKVSFAVACSAAFPPVFAPFKLNLKGRQFFTNYWEGREKWKPFMPPVSYVVLSDGGVYDNLGSEHILQEDKEKVPFVIIDAGTYIAPWKPKLKIFFWEWNIRIIETALDQIIALRRRVLYGKTTEKESERTLGTMLILGYPVENYLDPKKSPDFGKLSDEVIGKMPSYGLFSQEIDKLISDLRTDLDGFHDIEIGMLMWAGAIRMDIAVKRYLWKYLNDSQFNDTPQITDFLVNKIEVIEKILTKGRKRSNIGFLHLNLKKA